MFKFFLNLFKPWYKKDGRLDITSVFQHNPTRDWIILATYHKRCIKLTLPEKCTWTDDLLKALIHEECFDLVEDAKCN